MGLAAGVNGGPLLKPPICRHRPVAIGGGLLGVIVIVSVIATLMFARAGSDSILGRVDTSSAGTPAPEFDLPGLKGRPILLQQFLGSIVVVNFWASWCVPCREEVGSLESLARTWRPRGVKIVGIVENDTVAAARRFQRRYDIMRPSAMDIDRATAADFGVRGVPETYVIGRDGRLAGKVVGRLRGGQLDVVINTLLRGSSTKQDATQSGQ